MRPSRVLPNSYFVSTRMSPRSAQRRCPKANRFIAISAAASKSAAGMRVSVEIRLTAPPVGHVCVQLRRGEIGVAEHLLDAPQICASFEQVGREGMPQEVWMDAARLEARLLGQPLEDEEGARAGQRTALGVQEEFRTVTAVEERASSG